jgi:exopolysaccharide production protein ExoZ
MQARRDGPRYPSNRTPTPLAGTTAGQFTSEIRTVQALRAAACMMVVGYHTLQTAAGEGAITAWPNGSAGVDLFFVISGFVMLGSTRRLAARPNAAWIFLRRRAARLVPLYWLLTGIKYAIATAAPGMAPHTKLSFFNLLASLLFIPVRDLTGQIRPVLALRIRVWWVLPALTATALAGFFRTPSWPAPFALANGMVLEFAAGMLVWAIAASGWATRAPLAMALMAACVALLLTLPLAGSWRFLVWGGPAAAILLAAVALESRCGAKLPRGLLAVGDASYAIYLLHPFVVPALAGRGWAAALAAIPLSAAAGLVVHACLDAPLQRRARGFTQNVARAA